MNVKYYFYFGIIIIVFAATAAGIYMYGNKKYNAGYRDALKVEQQQSITPIILWDTVRIKKTVGVDSIRVDTVWIDTSAIIRNIATADTVIDNDYISFKAEYHSLGNLTSADYFNFDITYKDRDIYPSKPPLNVPLEKRWTDNFNVGIGFGVGVAAVNNKAYFASCLSIGVYYVIK